MDDLAHRVDWVKSELGNARHDTRANADKIHKVDRVLSYNSTTGVWRTATITMAGILGTGLLSWWSFGGERVNATEVTAIVKTVMEEHSQHPHGGSVLSSEFKAIQTLIEKRLDRMEVKIDELKNP